LDPKNFNFVHISMDRLISPSGNLNFNPELVKMSVDELIIAVGNF